ncbi:L-threonine O-3-phosphate decarboxylase [Albidovulum inexpectatum]|uniref:threonine-phosphate decarboxylase n=1 Tax=Albidovulum inexpectatum TaxID=196587 RepID=A0A2S5JDT7_9RHOB|nr:threonine-phosphate decarboxylase CobD [Albidovulum inexpectatum]PPB79558.1 L-threonine O-3-phosphate decarboxylase [Albidovulum inexpectatum]
MRDHGGNLDGAIARFGGHAGDWVDLSTGINRRPWPVPEGLPAEAWRALPTRTALRRLSDAARAAYGTGAAVLPVAGAQAAIQLIPRMTRPGLARVLSPTYNEHAAALAAAGWRVEEVTASDDLPGADLAVIVNPNNPDGRVLPPRQILQLAGRVGRLVVDESFADPHPACSVAARAGEAGMLVLRSFGKFYGLAGLRLGFALGAEHDIARLADMAGPWPVSGPAIAVGSAALADRDWAERMRRTLAEDAARLDDLAAGAGWHLVGGTSLFRLYRVPDAGATQQRLARGHVWSRIFPWSDDLIRLGLPGPEHEWQRLVAAMNAM